MYRILDQGKAQAMAALEAQEAEQRRRAEEQARPLTVRGILASLGIKTEQVDRMMLAASLGGAAAAACAAGGTTAANGARRSPPPHSSSSVGSTTTVVPSPLGSPKGAGAGAGSGSSRLLVLRGGCGGGNGGGGALPRSDSAGMDASFGGEGGAGVGAGAGAGGEQEWEQLEQLFGEAGRLAKARAKDLKALHATMLSLSTQGACVRVRVRVLVGPRLLIEFNLY